jgi:hypothetical protein
MTYPTQQCKGAIPRPLPPFLFLDVLTDRLHDSLVLPLNSSEARRQCFASDPTNSAQPRDVRLLHPFAFDLPAGYEGGLTIEAYLHPVAAEVQCFDALPWHQPFDWVGDYNENEHLSASKMSLPPDAVSTMTMTVLHRSLVPAYCGM